MPRARARIGALAIALLLVAALVPGALRAQDLVHTPQNPAFGGNTFNYQWLLSSAQAQNGLTDPDAPERDFGRRATSRTSLDDFSESLNRQLLNSITRQLFDAQLGTGQEGLQPGSYALGNFQVDIVEGVDGLIITIADLVNGGTTEVAVPFF